MLSISTRVTEGIRWICLQGTADDESLVAAFRQVWTAADYTPELPEIYDMREVDGPEVSLHGVTGLSRLNQELHATAPVVRVALLLPSDVSRTLAGRGLLHNRYAGANIALCRSHVGAKAWVSGTPDPI
jgi:hypothetical protein